MNRPSYLLSEEDYREVDFALTRTAYDWFDGEGSTMYLFGMRRPARVDRLRAEAIKTLEQCVTEKERPGLQALLDFCTTELTRRKAEIALEKAVRGATAVGVESWRIGWIVDNARDKR